MALNKDKLMQIIDEALLAFRYRDSQKLHFVDALADGLISNGVSFEADTNVGRKIETNVYDIEEVHHNCTVQILRNSVTGEQSIGWWPEARPPREF